MPAVGLARIIDDNSFIIAVLLACYNLSVLLGSDKVNIEPRERQVILM